MSGAVVDNVDAVEGAGRWRALALLGAAELLGMSLWFSASASVTALRAEWGLSESAAGWLTLAVQLGFVAGTLLSALLNLPDVISSRRLFALSAFAGAVVNALFGLFASDFAIGVTLRFMVGVCLAGVYPPGMKIMATWFRRGRGTALGVLVGALTLGKASPYLVNAVGSESWRANVLLVGDAPFATAPAKFDIGQAARVFRNRGVRLANFGYFGHMWELYAMWTWAP